MSKSTLLTVVGLLVGSGVWLSANEPPDAAALFSKLDRNSDDVLTSDEIADGQRSHFERLLKTGDTDKDGKLTKAEFLAAVERADNPGDAPADTGRPGPGERPDRPDPQQLFRNWDRNGDGKLTADELPEPLRERFQRAFDAFDTDALTQEQFAQALRRLGPPGGDRRFPSPAQIMEHLDRNKDGRLTRDEIPEPARRHLFPLFDRLKKEALTQDDLERNFRPQPPPGGPNSRAVPSVDEVFSRLDVNKDGTIRREEVPAEFRDRAAVIFDRAGKDALSRDDVAAVLQRERERAGRDGARPDRPPMRPDSRDGRPGSPNFRPGDRPPQRDPRTAGDPADRFAEAVFRILDADHNGELSADEAAEAGRAFVARLLQQADRPNDGSINSDEFRRLIREHMAARRGDAGNRPGPASRPGDRPRPADRPRPEFGPRPGDRTRPGDRPRRPEFDGNRSGRPADRPDDRRPNDRRPEPDAAGPQRPERPDRPQPQQGAAAGFDRDRFYPGGPAQRGGFAENRPPRPFAENPPGAGFVRRGDEQPDRPSPFAPRDGFAPRRPIAGFAGDRAPGENRPERPEPFVVRPRPPQFPGLPGIFRELDQDNDGQLSRAELEPLSQRFDEWDSNADGTLSPIELLRPRSED